MRVLSLHWRLSPQSRRYGHRRDRRRERVTETNTTGDTRRERQEQVARLQQYLSQRSMESHPLRESCRFRLHKRTKASFRHLPHYGDQACKPGTRSAGSLPETSCHVSSISRSGGSSGGISRRIRQPTYIGRRLEDLRLCLSSMRRSDRSLVKWPEIENTLCHRDTCGSKGDRINISR